MLTSKIKRTALDANLPNKEFDDIIDSPKRSRSVNNTENESSSDEDTLGKYRISSKPQITSPLATVSNMASFSRSSTPPSIKLMRSDNSGMENTEEFKKFYDKFINEAISNGMDNKDFSSLDTILMSLDNRKIESINITHVSILIKNLCRYVAKLDSSKEMKALIDNLINLNDWFSHPEEDFASNYMKFIKLLCSGQPKYISKILETFILQLSDNNISVTRDYHHQLFAYLVNGFPTIVSEFLNLLVRAFPNKNDTQARNINYIENLLEIMKYCKESRYSLMALIVEKMISIDVELQNEIDEMDSDNDESSSDMSGDDSENDSGSEEESDSDDEYESGDEKLDSDDEVLSDREEDENGMYLSSSVDKQSKVEDLSDEAIPEGEEAYGVEESNNIQELSVKLDLMLAKVSEFLRSNLTSEKLESGEGIEIYTNLKSIFKSHILPTYYTKSTQYLIFHASQEQEELMDSFLVGLLDVSFSKTESIESRVKALQFLSSFIARAKKMTKSQILFVCTYLVTWLSRYVAEREVEIEGMTGTMERFEHFYATFQALCYIFCFRHDIFKLKSQNPDSKKTELSVEEQLKLKVKGTIKNSVDSEWECELDRFYQRMILSKFNPLKYCNENVILMFANIAQKTNLVYCYTVIEKNNKDNILGIINSSSLGNISEKSLSGSNSSDKPLSTSGVSNATLSLTNTTSLQKKQFIDLQSYFPFDPLFLPTYKEFMKEYYIEWSEVEFDNETEIYD
ncbi:related to RNA polymerase I-specific transcription initiation factor RRN3 [Hanseniaspora guilliermondii]|uniref:Related to RNA polymerase I-specific transcription initiation factor RRN3 n=1 Tax=Hanseniaspora guilliermondii TaxID=56406 RepID=A0A1L0CSY3_9ASCO|nr:related to RNA polymerase I-specific transcription initiation factor RRN3 [Hanseniaspora guilliermondii]